MKIKEIARRADAPKLKLRIINGNSSHYNQVLSLNPLGLEGSIRKQQDGYVYFGTLKNSMPDKKGKYAVVNDYILPPFQLPVSNP